MADTDIEQDDNEHREGVQLKPSGAIVVYLDGEPHRLRRPRMREYRRLREKLQEAMDDMADLADEHDEWQRALNTRSEARDVAGEPTVTADERAEQRKRGIALRDNRESFMLSWWLEVGRTLTDKWPDDVDDLAVWMGESASSASILNHWRNLPSLSGTR